MIELFFGTDVQAVATALHTAITTYEQDEYTKISISGSDYSERDIYELLLGEDLFSSKRVYILSDIMKLDAVVQLLYTWQTAMHPTKKILWRELSIRADDKKNIQKAGIVVHEYKKTKPKDAKIFQLSDQLCTRNVHQLWLNYHALREEGVSPYAMVGTLWWQIKTLLLVAQSKKNPGLAPYTYTKSKKALQKYTTEELFQKAGTLLSIYHRGNDGGDDIEILLEKFIVRL